MTEYENNILSAGREFVQQVIAPIASEADEREEFPLQTFREMGRFGLFSTPYPEQYGGSEMGHMTYTGLIREVARASAAMAMTAVSHGTLTCNPIFIGGSEELKQRCLRPLISGQKIGAFAMTEPGAGSDISSIQTTAEESGDCFVLNGSKIFITNANIADIVVVVAKTAPLAGLLGLSLFVAEKGTPGFCASGRHERKLGMRAADTGELVFSDARIPKANLIGRKNRGFEILQKTLPAARLDMAAIAIGIAEAARDLCLEYVTQRKQFGKPLWRFQLVKSMLANMEMNINAADLLLMKGLRLRDLGKDFVKEASEAKLFASEMAVAVTKDAIQIHGANGYSRDFPLERFFRDAKLTEIGDGTSEIQRLVIADEMVRQYTPSRSGISTQFEEQSSGVVKEGRR
jgi:alkylation response protein AidB-like acyl-CoA dehydrogenase